MTANNPMCPHCGGPVLTCMCEAFRPPGTDNQALRKAEEAADGVPRCLLCCRQRGKHADPPTTICEQRYPGGVYTQGELEALSCHRCGEKGAESKAFHVCKTRPVGIGVIKETQYVFRT